MNRESLKNFILANYEALCDMPWLEYPTYEVFRRADNKKWFALIMDVPSNRLGADCENDIGVVNLKCDPSLIGSFIKKDGYFPAYHMNKEHWITVEYKTVPDEELKMLINYSYDSTAVRKRR